MHLGHYKHGRLDFDPQFTQLQCPQCNVFGHGKLDVYGEKLVETYGYEFVRMKTQEANTHKGYSREELETIIKVYGAATPK